MIAVCYADRAHAGSAAAGSRRGIHGSRPRRDGAPHFAPRTILFSICAGAPGDPRPCRDCERAAPSGLLRVSMLSNQIV